MFEGIENGQEGDLIGGPIGQDQLDDEVKATTMHQPGAIRSRCHRSVFV